METIKLRPREEKRLRAGHLWIYANEVDVKTTPLKGLEPGSLVRYEDSQGKPLGMGYINPNTLLCGRILSRDSRATIDETWFIHRIQAALALREKIYDAPYYRLIFGEADGLPGLVVDRFGDVLVAQCTTAGMDALSEYWMGALGKVLQPKGFVLRNDVSSRETEGLPRFVDSEGEIGDVLTVFERGVQFELPVEEWQKTGWFFDQASNREHFAKYVNGGSVLDVFSYYGGWSITAAKAGAKSVTCIDASQSAIDGVMKNAELNGVTIEAQCGDALALLKTAHKQDRKFDVVVVDPPALIKRKKDLDKGLGHYAALTRAAMNVMAADGILVSCSCSFHLHQDALLRMLLKEAQKANKRLQILEIGGQGPDHPVHPAIPETRYLKTIFARVTSG